MPHHRYIDWETEQERRRRLRPWLLAMLSVAVVVAAAGVADVVHSRPLTDDSVVATVTSTAQPPPSITPRTFPPGTP